MTPVIVLSKPSCVQCTATERWLREHDVPFEKVDVTSDAAALARAEALGYKQAPVVIAGPTHWSGFDPDKLAGLVD